jgi:hypothetical protein
LGTIKRACTAFDFGQYFRASNLGKPKIFQNEKSCSLAEGETVPTPVERDRALRTGTVSTQQASSVETDKGLKRELVYATG